MGAISMHAIREKLHPLHRLRKTHLFRYVSKHVRTAIPVNFPDIAHPVYVDLMRNLSWVLSRGKAIEVAERTNFERIVRAFDIATFWDVGANVGLYAFIFKSLRADGDVVMFEPDPVNADLIDRTTSRHKLDRAALVRKAVASRPGTSKFHLDNITGATGSLVAGEDGQVFVERHFGEASPHLTVDVTTLDREAETRQTPDLIKIDVEGAEFDVICGAETLLDERAPLLMLEVTPGRPEVLDTLRNKNYAIFDMIDFQPVPGPPVHNHLAVPDTPRHRALFEAMTDA